MRSAVCIALLLGMMLIPVSTLAAEGRAEPNCLNDTPAAFSSSTVIGDGACIKVNLGVLNPGDVYDISIIVSQDALDVLVFDENSVQPYDLGQSYRSSYENVPSTESALGSYEFHWKVPPSITSKSWYIVFDNLAHSGDHGVMLVALGHQPDERDAGIVAQDLDREFRRREVLGVDHVHLVDHPCGIDHLAGVRQGAEPVGLGRRGAEEKDLKAGGIDRGPAQPGDLELFGDGLFRGVFHQGDGRTGSDDRQNRRKGE